MADTGIFIVRHDLTCQISDGDAIFIRFQKEISIRLFIYTSLPMYIDNR